MPVQAGTLTGQQPAHVLGGWVPSQHFCQGELWGLHSAGQELEDTAGLGPDHLNKVSIEIRWAITLLLVEGLAFHL